MIIASSFHFVMAGSFQDLEKMPPFDSILRACSSLGAFMRLEVQRRQLDKAFELDTARSVVLLTLPFDLLLFLS